MSSIADDAADAAAGSIPLGESYCVRQLKLEREGTSAGQLFHFLMQQHILCDDQGDEREKEKHFLFVIIVQQRKKRVVDISHRFGRGVISDVSRSTGSGAYPSSRACHQGTASIYNPVQQNRQTTRQGRKRKRPSPSVPSCAPHRSFPPVGCRPSVRPNPSSPSALIHRLEIKRKKVQNNFKFFFLFWQRNKEKNLNKRVGRGGQ